jgi:hypothetical protein
MAFNLAAQPDSNHHLLSIYGVRGQGHMIQNNTLFTGMWLSTTQPVKVMWKTMQYIHYREMTNYQYAIHGTMWFL